MFKHPPVPPDAGLRSEVWRGYGSADDAVKCHERTCNSEANRTRKILFRDQL